MNTVPFNVYYIYRNVLYQAQIKPCCREDNVVDYAVWVDHLLAFTLTRRSSTDRWILAMHNADDEFDDELIQVIGREIEKKMAEKQQ